MRVVITGAYGQLGSDLKRLLEQEKSIELYPFSQEEMDITDQTILKIKMDVAKPDIILHCAANTNVDGCELESDEAYRVNTFGTRNVAVEALRHQSKMVYISTDYVFDGSSKNPYHELSSPNPISVYGASKLAGEDMVRHLCNKYFIVRTSWLYGVEGNNFVKTILKLVEDRDNITIVDDQIGCPTYSRDLAGVLILLMGTEAYGTYHVTNSGQCSWHEFACEILEKRSIRDKKVHPIKTVDLGRPAPRPHYSVLTSLALKNCGIATLSSWQDGLHRFFEEYKN